MNITIFEIESWEREAFEALASEHDVAFEEEPVRPENVGRYADADAISVFTNTMLDENLLKRFDDLKLIATRSTGFDHIDTDYCKAHGITVSNVPTYGDQTVAEHVFALLLAISHRLVEAVDRTRRGDFSHKGLRGFDLQGKVLGIVGTGGIGEHTIRIAKGFGMEVLAFDVAPRDDLAEELAFSYEPLERVLAESDVISLHVPLNEHTRGMIDEEAFGRMKDGVVLINTARGAVVDVEALLRALVDGKVGAAGLDVLPAEETIREESELLHAVNRKEHLDTLVADHALFRMRNVIVTPHSAFNTREAVQRILDTTVENISCFIQGDPQNVAAGAAA